MRTGPPGPANRRQGNGHFRADGASQPTADSLDARRARLAALWTLVLRRFRDYVSGRPPEEARDNRAEEDR